MKQNIALVTGGLSGEAQISYKSAISVSNHTDRDKFNLYKIDINPEGWWYLPESGERSAVDRSNFSIMDQGQNIQFDAILLCIHGTPGEDGKLQGYFDMLGLPYTSCDAATSALTFNKRYTVAVAAFAGIHVAKSLHLFKHTPVTVDSILSQLQLPLFVKPNNGGSSIGISRVDQSSELAVALEKAFQEDDQILVEEFISGREFTIGVFKSKGSTTVLPITEIKTGNAFFDFEAKYQGKSEEITPAAISPMMQDQLTAASKRVYEVLNCRGVVRIDFIYNETKEQPYMLEVNTVPGQSAASVIPQQVKAMGWSLTDFYTDIIEEALK
ncbi:MAG: D-alanine--D-alanine ligase A [Bacteroidetes bacterium 24-39-8]|nr:MAG: D-alanine--D-alanine ligase A [Sphingobacteriia bacterium 35-40-8]OYZ48625.1 MAG: D-alanine--D-alanine ligase A [Bacteroidetes bacterium 24-39-8]HQS55550.1 D-alanine--D-alanine ligase [Sediminibacterium sp.]